MTAKEFVALWKMKKDRALEHYLGPRKNSSVAMYISQMKLDQRQKKLLRKMMDDLLSDTYYELLLGLDGSRTIGPKQETYMIFGEDGNLISDCGEIEGEAFVAFDNGRYLAASPVDPPEHPKNLHTERWKKRKTE